jgi:hypothetical protein
MTSENNKPKDDLEFRLELENKVIKFLEEKWNCTFIHKEKDFTKSASYSPIDGFMIRDNKLVAMIENRSRKEKLSDIKSWGGILINYDKLKKAIELSQTLRVPFFFVAYFFNDGIVVGWEIVNKDGMIECEMTLKRKLAQDNLLGGTDKKKERNVAILSNNAMFEVGRLINDTKN